MSPFSFFYQMVHEMFHAIHHAIDGPEYLTKPPAIKESFVWGRLRDLFWGYMNKAEQDHADWYLSTFGSGT